MTLDDCAANFCANAKRQLDLEDTVRAIDARLSSLEALMNNVVLGLRSGHDPLAEARSHGWECAVEWGHFGWQASAFRSSGAGGTKLVVHGSSRSAVVAELAATLRDR